MMIVLNQITHAYGAHKVLKDFNLQIKTGHLTCLLGSSGCGKTTILRLMAGLEVPQQGEILIDDVLVTGEGAIVVPPVQRNISFIFQDLALWPHFTVYKNVAFGLQERKEKQVKDKVLDILDFFGLREYSLKFPHQLSGGQKQLLAIARALVLKPSILLMDEPLASLDVKLKRKILAYIKKLKQEFDVTLVYVTHDHKEAFAIADDVVLLHEGKVEEKGSVEQLKRSDNEFTKYFLEY